MYKNLIKISTKNMAHDEWLEYRRKSIGGSDAAAIVGMNTYSSPYSIWADKLGKLSPKEDNEAMRLGRDLEDYVAKRFTEATGKKVRRENKFLVNPDIPFAHANVDRMIIGEDAGFEAKTTSAGNVKNFKNGDYPENYYVQCVHYLAVTGCKRWYLGVLILGVGFMWFIIERNEDEIAALMRAEEAFWKCVEDKVPPAANGRESTSETLAGACFDPIGDRINLMAYESDIRLYMTLQERIGEFEQEKKKIADRIKAVMGTASRGETTSFKVSLLSSERTTFDYKKFAKDNPHVALRDYLKTTAIKTFKISEI